MQLSPDEQSIRSLAEHFFRDRAPLETQQAAAHDALFAGTRADPRRGLCEEMAELGFFSQAVDESRGGLGMRPVVSGLICEAAGRELSSGLWLDQLLAVHSADMAGASMCEELTEGRQLASLAMVTTREPRDGRAAVATVQFADDSDVWLVLDGHGVSIGHPRQRQSVADVPSVDLLCTTAAVRVDDLDVIEYRSVTSSLYRRLAHRLGLLVAAYSVGAASRCLELAVDYAKQRQQFGRPIGSFQAIKHRAANAQIELIHARSAVYHALATGVGAAEARVAADRCLRSTAESSLQMHGGIGFTAEVPMHVFLRVGQRLRSWPQPVEWSFDDIRHHLAIDGELSVAVGS